MSEKDKMLEEAGWKRDFSSPVKWKDRFYDRTGTICYRTEFWENEKTGEKRTIDVVLDKW